MTTHDPVTPASPRAQPSSGPDAAHLDAHADAHSRGEAHPSLEPEERRVVSLLVVGLVAFVICIPIIAVLSESPLVNVLLGFSPLLLTLLADIMLATRHYKVITFWLALVVIHVFALGILWLLNLFMVEEVNLAGSLSTSVLFSIIITVIVMLADAKRVKESVKDAGTEPVVAFKPEKLDEYIHAIEDKAKGLNFAIGRVYRASNGGTARMRERLRIPSEWYNEFNAFNALETDDKQAQLDQAAVLLRKIRDRLSLFTHKEKDVFQPAEIGGLKHLARNKDGEDRVIDVLKTNDRDPVEHYYVSAVDFCDRILREIEEKD